MKRRIRYAVVGAGHIAQNAILPAFSNAQKNSELTAICSDDSKKRKSLGRMYKIKNLFSYGEFDEACRADLFGAVFIALPNSLHADYTCRAAEAKIHVLCEKPMAVTSHECSRMIQATQENKTRLMIAYRLHFEQANLKAAEIAQGGKLGNLRFFNSVISMQVRENNIRTEQELGGGPLHDIGIYCINAARYIFRAEPLNVAATAAQSVDPRFEEIEEAISVLMNFPGERVAAFTCSFGASDVSQYHVVGTKGHLRLDPAYEYEGELTHYLTVKSRTKSKTYRSRDQFAPEILYFSNCIINNLEPEPGGTEGLKDVIIIEAIQKAIRTKTAVELVGLPADPPPRLSQEIERRPARKRELVGVESAHR